MINYEMIELLAAFSVAVWALMSKTPMKLAVKWLGGKTYQFATRWKLETEEWERYVILFFVAVIASILVGAAQVIDLAAVTDNFSDEWLWIRDAELISAAGVISLDPAEFSLLYYVDLLLTIILITFGSSAIHRCEKWLTGNGLLFDALRQWLINNQQATGVTISE